MVSRSLVSSLFRTSIFCLINRTPFQLKSNRGAYDGYVPMAYDEYLDKVSRYALQFKNHFFTNINQARMKAFLTNVLAHKLTETVNGVTM